MSENHKGEVTYVIRADDEHIEADLEKSYQKVEQAAQKSADKTVEIEQEKTQEIKQEFDKVESSAKSTSAKVEKSWENAARDIEDAFEDVGDEIEESTEDVGSAFDNVSGAIKGSLLDAATGAVPLLGQIEKLTAGLTATKAAALGIGIAFAGVAVAGVNVATDMDTAMNSISASTGISKAGLEDYRKILENIYANNYGESFEDIANSMAIMEQYNISDIVGDNDELQRAIESGYALRDVFGYEIPESARAANTLMERFGVTADEAYSLIAAGAQDGLDYSGELLDTINEYSVQFEKLGFTADEMFHIFDEGADSGAWNLDKIGDAVKEFSIRAIDGSDTTKQGFELLGYSAKASAEEIADAEDEIEKLEQQLKYAKMEQEAFNEKTSALTKQKNADKIAEYSFQLELAKENLVKMTEETGESEKSMDELIAKFGQGGEEAKQAFQEVINGLLSIEDPLEQNTAGVALFGTMWEDLGPEVVTALADIEEGSYDTADAMNEIKEVKYDDLQSMLEGLKRNVELLVIPIGEALIPLLSMLIESVLPILTGLLGPLIDLFAALLSPILEVISAGIKPLIDILNWLISNAIEPLIRIISAVLVPLFSGSLESMFSSTTSVIGNVINSFKNLLNFIKNVFTGNWKGAWTNIKNIFSNAVKAWSTIFKAPINTIVDGWNKLVSSLGKVKIPNWVPIVGGKSFSLPKMKRLKVGLDYVPTDMFPAYLDEGEWVLTKEEASALRSLGGIEGIMALMADRNGLSGGMQSVFKNTETRREITIHTHVDLDGKEIGYSVTPFVDANMAIDEELKERGN